MAHNAQPTLVKFYFPWFILYLLFTFVFFSCAEKKDKAAKVIEYDDPNAHEPVDIHYSVHGNGDTTLLFIHGLDLDESFWADQVRTFSGQYKVVTLDLAGHGKSGNNRQHWTVKSFAKDIIQLIQKEKFNNIILIGHSMGGDIALDVADSIPSSIIGLIGVDNFKDIEFKMDRKFEEGLKEHLHQWRSDYKKYSEQFVRNMLDSATDEAVAQRIIRKYQEADPDVTLAIFKNLFAVMGETKTKLNKLQFPLRLIINDHPPINYEGWKSLPRGYHVSIMKKTGHFPMVERPEEFNGYLKSALSSINKDSKTSAGSR
jgi:sigma-B regulation protein RsbQ